MFVHSSCAEIAFLLPPPPALLPRSARARSESPPCSSSHITFAVHPRARCTDDDARAGTDLTSLIELGVEQLYAFPREFADSKDWKPRAHGFMLDVGAARREHARKRGGGNGSGEGSESSTGTPTSGHSMDSTCVRHVNERCCCSSIPYVLFLAVRLSSAAYFSCSSSKCLAFFFSFQFCSPTHPLRPCPAMHTHARARAHARGAQVR